MRFQRLPLLELVLPSNAGPNDPQTIIGPIIKAQLVAYYAPDLVVSNFIFQAQQNVFNYMCQVAPELNNPFTAFGSVGFDISDQPFIQESWRVPIFASGDGGAPLITGFPVQIASTIAPIQAYNGIEVIDGGLAVIDGVVDFASPQPVFINSPAEVVNVFDIQPSNGGDLQSDGISSGRGMLVGAYTLTAGLVATSTGTEVAVASASWVSEPTLTFVDGRMYRVVLQTIAGNIGVGAATNDIRIRKGTASTTGTLFGRYRVVSPGNGEFASSVCIAYIKNTSGANVATKLSVTNQRIAGSGNANLAGDATDFHMTMIVEDIGSVADHAALATNSLSV